MNGNNEQKSVQSVLHDKATLTAKESRQQLCVWSGTKKREKKRFSESINCVSQRQGQLAFTIYDLWL